MGHHSPTGAQTTPQKRPNNAQQPTADNCSKEAGVRLLLLLSSWSEMHIIGTRHSPLTSHLLFLYPLRRVSRQNGSTHRTGNKYNEQMWQCHHCCCSMDLRRPGDIYIYISGVSASIVFVFVIVPCAVRSSLPLPHAEQTLILRTAPHDIVIFDQSGPEFDFGNFFRFFSLFFFFFRLHLTRFFYFLPNRLKSTAPFLLSSHSTKIKTPQQASTRGRYSSIRQLKPRTREAAKEQQSTHTSIRGTAHGCPLAFLLCYSSSIYLP